MARIATFLFLLYPFIDLVRKLTGLSAVVYLLYDLVLLLALVYVLFNDRIRTASFLFVVLSILFFAYCFVLSFDTNSAIVLNILGLKTYVFLLLFLFIAMSKVNFEIELNIVLYGIIFVASLIYMQFALKLLGIDFLPSIEHTFRSFGRDEINLFSGPFSSSKKCSRFLLISFCFYYYVARPRLLLVSFVFIAVVLTGSRESIILFIAFMFLFTFRRNIKTYIYLSPLIALGVIGGLVALQDQSNILFRFALSAFDIELIFQRVVQVFPPNILNVENHYILFGHGPGVYGQETKFIPGSRDLIAAYVSLSDLEILSGGFSYGDSGLLKVVIEIGVFGLSFLILLLTISISSFLRDGQYFFIFLITLLAFLFFKAHPILNDSGLLLLILFSKFRYYEKNTSLL